MGVLLERAMAYFQDDDWDIHPISDTVVQTAFKGDNGEWDCLAVVLEQSDHFLFYSILPHKVPEKLFANHGLNIGNFEFDLSQGEVRFKTSVQAKTDQFTHELFQSLVHHNVLVVDEYMPGILSILADSMSAEAAIMMIESPAIGDA
jgi:hypothetical protein